jgi:hypothetical protein
MKKNYLWKLWGTSEKQIFLKKIFSRQFFAGAIFEFFSARKIKMATNCILQDLYAQILQSEEQVKERNAKFKAGLYVKSAEVS